MDVQTIRTQERQTEKSKSNNANFIRFLACLMVIYSHSFGIVGQGGDPLSRISGDQLSFGNLAVCIFFLFSGFFLAKSILRKEHCSAKEYFSARFRRVEPPLVFVVVSCAVLGVFFSTYRAAEYYLSPKTYLYLLNSVYILIHDLPGVFTENPSLPTVNGALWTMPVQIVCYIAFFIAYKLKLLHWRRLWITLPVFPLFFYIEIRLGNLSVLSGDLFFASMQVAIRACLMFLGGIYIYIYICDASGFCMSERTRRWIGFAVPLTGLLVAILLKEPVVGLYCVLPPVLFASSFSKRQCPKILARLGNYSYPAYLWGWPVQQALVQISRNTISRQMDFLLGSVIALLLGIATQFIVDAFEKSIKKS